MSKKINKLDAILSVLENGIKSEDEGVKLVLHLTGDEYSEDNIEKSLKSVIKALNTTDLAASKKILKYRLVTKGNNISIEKYNKDQYNEILKSKKQYTKKQKERLKNKETSMYQDEEDVEKQMKIINEILAIRKIVKYFFPGTEKDEINLLKSSNMNDLEKHRDKLISKNPLLKNKIEEELKKV